MEGVLDSSERSALRRAVGGETLATLTEAVSRVGVLREPTIPVSDIVALEDLRLEWIWAPALAVIEAARALAARDVAAEAEEGEAGLSRARPPRRRHHGARRVHRVLRLGARQADPQADVCERGAGLHRARHIADGDGRRRKRAGAQRMD